MTDNNNDFKSSFERFMHNETRKIKNDRKLTQVRREIIANTIVLDITPKILEMISGSVLNVCDKDDPKDFERLLESVVYTLHDLLSKAIQDLDKS